MHKNISGGEKDARARELKRRRESDACLRMWVELKMTCEVEDFGGDENFEKDENETYAESRTSHVHENFSEDENDTRALKI
ncbi:hypothetical protein PoB_006183100 [Plakobranchus ocellatus]|uniref:Uncharacterized protein n=1 Tax=Plakobranchus ocellatus TaxID=259542 RepID=A0AAV4CUF4_9GAST|nr:hypothetical protein PoB_006183100 [Plakobranchus ocellatus]